MLESSTSIKLPRESAAFARLGRSCRAVALVLLLGPAACTSSPAVLSEQPDFDVMTPAGVASVSIRQAPLDMTDAQFVKVVRIGMERATAGGVIGGPVDPLFPSQRVVWHVDGTASRGTSHLVVNVFNGLTPYAYEQSVVSTDAPPAAISATIESMSKQLLAAVAAKTSTIDFSPAPESLLRGSEP